MGHFWRHSFCNYLSKVTQFGHTETVYICCEEVVLNANLHEMCNHNILQIERFAANARTTAKSGKEEKNKLKNNNRVRITCSWLWRAWREEEILKYKNVFLFLNNVYTSHICLIWGSKNLYSNHPLFHKPHSLPIFWKNYNFFQWVYFDKFN